MAIRTCGSRYQGNIQPRLTLVQDPCVSSKDNEFCFDFQEDGNRRQIAVGAKVHDARKHGEVS